MTITTKPSVSGFIATTPRLPKTGETVAGSAFSTAAGGKGANQALAARRAGAAVRHVSGVGKSPRIGEDLHRLRHSAHKVVALQE